jgi:hypothetical protein
LIETVSSYLIEVIGQARRLLTEDLGMAVDKHLSGKLISQQGCPGRMHRHSGYIYLASCPNLLVETIDLEICTV